MGSTRAAVGALQSNRVSASPRSRGAAWAGALLALAVLTGTAGLSSSAAATPGSSAPAGAQYPVGTIAEGLVTEITDPGGMPPGVVNGPCTPPADHPYPVVLVHGTFANENVSWQALAPMLADARYCVFGFDYGATADTDGRFYAEAAVESSAAQLADFVRQVLAWTGAAQVDIVGHSQGGMMPRYYMKFLGGASLVHTLVGLAPSNHGTTLDGLTTLAGLFGDAEYQFGSQVGCPACSEQIAGSPFLQNLNAGGDTAPGPRYVVIESEDDEVVTPYASAFLSGPQVIDVTLQDQCPTDLSDHLGIIYDPVALQDVMAALAEDGGPLAPLPPPACPVVPPFVG